MEDFTKQTRIQIEISSVNYNIEEPIEFIPGKNYEKVILK